METHTPHIKTKAATNTRKHKDTHAHTPARALNVRQDKGSDTLAELRCYVNITAPPSTHAQVRTHARAHTAATLAQVRRYVFKHNGSTSDTMRR